MDDVLMVVARNSDWDADHFLEDFNTGCYFSPLKLSEATNKTFLETTFKTTRKNSIRYWLKNENKPTEAAKVWRYAHFHCYSNFEQKRTTLESCLKKVARNASDSRALCTCDTRGNFSRGAQNMHHQVEFRHRRVCQLGGRLDGSR